MMKRQKVLKYFLLVIVSLFAGTTRSSCIPLVPPGGGVSFVKASEIARPCVVYIKVQSEQRVQSFFWDPFGTMGQVSSSGSGVIISSDGYIVTNSHVVKNAEKIEVILNNNKKSFVGKVVGFDASSDLALVKIDATGLPFITFANSDDLPIGDWVLAVGNPFNLTSTVTAGIVSAKGRNISLNRNQFPIESFIQTDAAINPGNSGGALVNVDGNLVGINTAIMSQTGSYAGYGFAIPSNIVKKIIGDLKDFGYVQRAFLEADVVDIDENLAATIKTDNVSGVYVRSVIEDGNADKAGLRKGDVIVKANDKTIETLGQFEEQLAYHRPGDKMSLEIKRGNDLSQIKVTLTNMNGTLGQEKSAVYHSAYLGADLSPISKIEMQKYNVGSGIRVSNQSGMITRFNLQDGFVITSLNNQSYTDPKELEKAFENAGGTVSIQGINTDGTKASYFFSGGY